MPCGTLVNDQLKVKTVTWQQFNTAGTVIGSGSYTNQADGGSKLVSSGQCTPGFHKKRRSGQLLPYTNWFQEEFSGTLGVHPSRIKYTGNQAGDYFSDWITGTRPSIYEAPIRYLNDSTLASIAPDVSYLLNQAAASAYSSHSYDLGTFLGELPETLKMLSNTVQRFKDIKDRKFRKLKHFDPHSFLLEARYGWSPMYRDLKAMHKQFLRQQKAITRVVGRSQASASTSASWTTTTSDAMRTITYAWQDAITVTCMASVAADYTQSAWKLNPVATGYELIPYSFVVDWFWNLSQAIRASSLILGASALTACGGAKTTNTRTFTLTATAKSGCVYTQNPSGSATTSAICTSRWPTSVPYVPPIQVRLDGNKIADLIAMISQLKAMKAFGKAIKEI